jgi:hypothetical protein
MTDRTALEIEIERGWVALCSSRRRRTVYLTSCNHLVWGDVAIERSHRSEEVGTYDTSVPLKDFRDDVFHVHDNRGRRHGG